MSILETHATIMAKVSEGLRRRGFTDQQIAEVTAFGGRSDERAWRVAVKIYRYQRGEPLVCAEGGVS